MSSSERGESGAGAGTYIAADPTAPTQDDRTARLEAAAARYERAMFELGEATRAYVELETGARMSVADAASYMRRREAARR